MRIISGEFRRRVLISPKDAETTRPMPDRVKESLFSILRGHCEGATIFDGFAGTGSIGLEALSRGAKRCLFIERDKTIANLLRDNIALLGCEDRSLVIQGDALGSAALASAPRPLTLAFLDPPYPLVQEPLGFKRVMAQVAALVELLTPDGFVILRTPWPLQHEEAPAPLASDFDSQISARTSRDRFNKEKRGMVKKGRSWRRHADAMDPARAEEHLTGKKRSTRPILAHPDDDATDATEAELIEEGLLPTPEGTTASEAGRQDDASDALRDQLDAMEEKLAAAESELTLPPRKMITVDLRLPGSLGPETHEYTTMALHLYARLPAQS